MSYSSFVRRSFLRGISTGRATARAQATELVPARIGDSAVVLGIVVLVVLLLSSSGGP